jgi:YfiH family protein
VPTSSQTASEEREIGGLPVLAWPAFDGFELDAFVTTRHGGVSTGGLASLNLGMHVGDDLERVRTNRARVAQALGTTLDNFVYCDQAHLPNVQVVTEEHRGRGTLSAADAFQQTDAMVTAVPGIALVAMVADCVPLVLFDPGPKILAVVHAGWRGTVLDVTTAAVETMRTLGAEPARIVAGIGPAIHPDRYQVGEDVVSAAEQAFADRTGHVVRPDGNGKWVFDLWRANALQLEAAGVPAAQIHTAGRETGPGTPFFSHRFEGPCGRFAAVARIRPE